MAKLVSIKIILSVDDEVSVPAMVDTVMNATAMAGEISDAQHSVGWTVIGASHDEGVSTDNPN